MKINLFQSKYDKNPSLYRQIYEEYKNTMYSVAYDICKNPDDAEDIVADSIEKIIRYHQKTAEGSFRTDTFRNFVITLTKNAAIDFLKKRKREVLTGEDIDFLPDEQNTEDLVIKMENYQELMECINELHEGYKEILRLKILHDLPTKEVADILNISESNVNVRYLRARRALQKKLKERGIK